jgi:hypothetical protein
MLLANVTAVELAPLHILCNAGVVVNTGVGFTIILAFKTVPAQALAVGVIPIAATTGVLPVLVAGKAVMFPVPVALSPMLVVLLVHI